MTADGRLDASARWWRAAIVFFCGGGLAAFALLRRTVHFSLPSTCALHTLTGLPCPLCGGTRAAEAFLQGNFERAITLNALAIPAVLLLAAILLLLALEAATGRPIIRWADGVDRLGRWTPCIMLFLLIWWLPQLVGAFQGSKAELLDLRNPIARTLNAKIHPLLGGLHSTKGS